MLLEAL